MNTTTTPLRIIQNRIDPREYLYFDERDPCYTWLFPLRLGPIEPLKIWQPMELRRPVDKLTLYVHIPYCRFICEMCPFTHEPLGRRDLSAYVNALRNEISFYAQHPNARDRSVTTLYFGGGTASTLTPDQVALIVDDIRTGFDLHENCEITLECHPRTVNPGYLKQIHDIGINRISFGIQSFNQKYIDSINLHQRVEQSKQIVADALCLGFKTVAIDLMYRYPGQDTIDLVAELDTALELGVQGLSLYALDPELRNMNLVANTQASVNIESEMFYYLHDRLHDVGFVHVAQPDYAKPGHENIQLRDLWGAPQAENLGFGAGAFSEMFNGYTWCNIHDSNAYIASIERGEIPILMGQQHSWDDTVARYPALGVRCLEVPLHPFREKYGVDLLELYRFELRELVNHGFVKIEHDNLLVTRKGKFYIDNISKAFYNLANRGKPQLWGVDLVDLKPEIISLRTNALEMIEMHEWK